MLGFGSRGKYSARISLMAPLSFYNSCSEVSLLYTTGIRVHPSTRISVTSVAVVGNHRSANERVDAGGRLATKARVGGPIIQPKTRSIHQLYAKIVRPWTEIRLARPF